MGETRYRCIDAIASIVPQDLAYDDIAQVTTCYDFRAPSDSLQMLPLHDDFTSLPRPSLIMHFTLSEFCLIYKALIKDKALLLVK